MTISAIVFDIGGVLEIVEDEAVLERRWGGRLGMTAAEWRAAAATVDPDNLVRVGAVTEAQFRERYAAATGMSPAQAEEFMADVWDWYCGRLDGEMMAYAARLRPRFRIAILSNSTDGARREEEARYAFSELFDPVIYSHEVGLAKPDPRIYELTCELLAAAPGEVIFVDDKTANVTAAAAIGMHGILHASAACTAETIAAIDALISGNRRN